MAITIVQTQSATGTSPLSVTLTSTTPGNSLIAAIGANVGTLSTSAVSGSDTLAAVVQQADSTFALAEIWLLDAITGGSTSIVLTNGGGASHYSGVIFEVSGIGGAGGSFDQKASTFHDSTTPLSWTSNTCPTLSQASELLIGVTGMGGLASAITGPSSPWTNTSPTAFMIAGQKIVSATTGQAYAGSTTVGGTGRSASAIASFKAGSNVPPIPNKARLVNQSVMRSAVW